MEPHIKHLTHTAYFHLCNISRFRLSLSQAHTETLVHAYAISQLDYCNAAGLPTKQMNTLHVQNSAARIITGTHRHEHITPIPRDLHWFPIKQRIDFKFVPLTFKAPHGSGPLPQWSLTRKFTSENTTIVYLWITAHLPQPASLPLVHRPYATYYPNSASSHYSKWDWKLTCLPPLTTEISHRLPSHTLLYLYICVTLSVRFVVLLIPCI